MPFLAQQKAVGPAACAVVLVGDSAQAAGTVCPGVSALPSQAALASSFLTSHFISLQLEPPPSIDL